MRYQQLGASGLTVSGVGLGCNTFGDTVPGERVPEIVHAALDAGVTFFDSADLYGSRPGEGEELLGKALSGQRDDVILATKFGMDVGDLNGSNWGRRGSRRYIKRAVEGSLSRLNTDWIDLYQVHEPDKMTPIEETLAALDDLVREGKVRYVGCSNFAGWQLADAFWISNTSGYSRFISAQNPYSLLNRDIERELVPAAENFGMGILPYYPLASGLLTGKYRRGHEAPEGTRLATRPQRLDDANFDNIEALESFADKRELKLLDVAIGGLAAQPGVSSVISGASTSDQVRRNVVAANWVPTAEDLAEIDEITQ